MKIFSYYICMVVTLVTGILAGCSEEEEKHLPLFSGELSVYDFAPTLGKGGTLLIINGEQFPLDVEQVKVSVNGVDLKVLRCTEEQIVAEVPDEDAVDAAPVCVSVNGKTVQSKVPFTFHKVSVVGFSPTYGKVGTEVKVLVENMPDNVTTLNATFNNQEVECRSDATSVTLTIPETTPGIYPIVIQLNSRMLTIEGFEYKEVMFERTVTTLAGNTEWGFVDAQGTDARFKLTGWADYRGAICVDNDGNVFMTDAWNCAIRKITPDGTVSTFAKSVADSPDDTSKTDWGADWRFDNDGNGTKDIWLWTAGMDMDGDGNLYVVNHKTAHMVRFASDGMGYYFGWRAGVSCAVDKTRQVAYIMSPGGDIFMKTDLNDYGKAPVDKEGTKIISNGGDGGMAVDEKTGDLYVTNVKTHMIMKYPYQNWNNSSVVAGSGISGNTNGSAKEASFDQPWGLAFTPDGNLLVAGVGEATPAFNKGYKDSSIRHIDLTTGMVTTFAGGASGSENGTFIVESYAGMLSSEAFPASFDAPVAICIDKQGTVYVLDRGEKGNCIKKIATIEK